MNDENDKKISEVTVQPITDEQTATNESVHVIEPLKQTETKEEEVTASIKEENTVTVTSEQTLAEEAKRTKEEEKRKKEEERWEEEEAEVKILKAAIAEQAREDEQPQSSNFTLRKILGGDILSAHILRNNIWLIIVIVGFIIVYISNRYSVQKYLLEIDKLNTELEDAKYRALSSSSQLTEKSRESHILELLKNRKDSVLKMSDRPPYIINVPEK
ncbi:MAG: FtsL-like putative cell division protein [Prevotella histicola]|uniref:FtsL-like putative cell division protein n=1 Tax=Prevotella histicola TaxID=470565 RepID=UPI00360A9488